MKKSLTQLICTLLICLSVATVGVGARLDSSAAAACETATIITISNEQEGRRIDI